MKAILTTIWVLTFTLVASPWRVMSNVSVPIFEPSRMMSKTRCTCFVSGAGTGEGRGGDEQGGERETGEMSLHR